MSNKPDWNYWKGRFGVSVTDAIYLSYDLEPRKWSTILGGMSTDRSNEFRDKFGGRQEDLQFFLQTDGSGANGVNLSEFAKWVLSRGWKIPPELEALAKCEPDSATHLGPRTTQSPHENAPDNRQKWEIPERWEYVARQIGKKWMLAEEKRTGKRPGVTTIANYVEGELSNQKIIGNRGKFLDAATIKREALTGITGRPPNGKGANK